MRVCVRPKPLIQKEYGPSFPLLLHTFYTMGCPTALVGVGVSSGCHVLAEGILTYRLAQVIPTDCL
jgi:hypothetical protein